MALDPSVMAILQGRRQFATRGPVAAGAQTDPQEPPEYGLPTPAPVAVPAPPPEAKSLARANRMRGYMQANGMTPITYGANNERRGNLPVGSGLPGSDGLPTGGKPMQSAGPPKPNTPALPIKSATGLTAGGGGQYSGPPIPGMPLSNNASNLSLGGGNLAGTGGVGRPPEPMRPRGFGGI